MFYLFVVTFISSTFIYILISIFRGGLEVLDITESTLFGILFSVGMVLFYRFTINNIHPKELSELEYKDLKTRQFRIIKSRLTLFEVKRKLVESSYFRAENVSFRDETLCFRKRTSAFSWGENIAIRQAEINIEEEYSYEISSKPTLPLQWFDYGVNYRNIKELEKLIS